MTLGLIRKARRWWNEWPEPYRVSWSPETERHDGAEQLTITLYGTLRGTSQVVTRKTVWARTRKDGRRVYWDGPAGMACLVVLRARTPMTFTRLECSVPFKAKRACGEVWCGWSPETVELHGLSFPVTLHHRGDTLTLQFTRPLVSFSFGTEGGTP